MDKRIPNSPRVALLTHHKPLRLRKCPLNTQQQPIRIDSRILHLVIITDKHLIQRGNAQQLIPIGTVASQAGNIRHQYQAYLAQPHIGVEPLKASPFLAVTTRLAQILINYHNLLTRLAQRLSSYQRVLFPLTLAPFGGTVYMVSRLSILIQVDIRNVK